ncbi:MAG TPA: aryl-sulfate sulfotransferase [Planctomycetota bacterium]
MKGFLLFAAPLLPLACGDAAAGGTAAEVPAAEVPAAAGPDAGGPDAGGPPDPAGFMSPGEADPEAGTGVVLRKDGAFDGYTMIAPLNSTMVYLLDMDGKPVHEWRADSAPGGHQYLLADGTLLRAGREDVNPKFRGGGIGGRVQRLAPDGSVVWHYSLASEMRVQHHDVEPLPNGNVLMIAWERKSAEEALARGRDPRGVGKAGLWPDAVYEVEPVLPEGGKIVWEWHSWDHLARGAEPQRPGRFDINLNFSPPEEESEEDRQAREDREEQMAALGYAGGEKEAVRPVGPLPPQRDRSGDWMHTNSVDYLAELDLILLSSPELCEIYLIDHSTTTAQAATSSGGRWGKGGDVLWRFGNPQNYGAGAASDQWLRYQHNPTFLPYAAGGDLRVLVFNNGGGRPDGSYSSVEELVLPFDAKTGFTRAAGEPYGPAEAAWTYKDAANFFSAFISGAQRLENGNTLICSGASGHVFEVTRAGEVVWDYRNDLGGEVKPPDHAGNAPPKALYRATRLAADHPGVQALLR